MPVKPGCEGLELLFLQAVNLVSPGQYSRLSKAFAPINAATDPDCIITKEKVLGKNYSIKNAAMKSGAGFVTDFINGR